MKARALACVLPCLAACPSDPGTPQDAALPDGGAGGGLTLTWTTTTPIPGPVTDDLRVDDALLSMRSIRALGDAATGEFTTASDVTLSWADGEAPDDIVFDQAPPGRYSSLELRLDGSPSLRLRGEVRLDGTWWPFEIIDDEATTVERELDVELAPGQGVTIPLAFDLAALAALVDFADVEPDDGVLRVDDEASGLEPVREALHELLEGDEAELEQGDDGSQR
jgi:hypothetical protein